MSLNCPECKDVVVELEYRWECNNVDCSFKAYKTMVGYSLTEEDIECICNNKPTPKRPFVSKEGKEFSAPLIWASEGTPDVPPEKWNQVTFQPFKKEFVEGSSCPDHDVPLRVSEKRYYCPTKTGDDWCPVGIWRNIQGHNVTKEEAVELLDGLVVGPWTVESRMDGKPYQITAEWNFDKHKVDTQIIKHAKSQEIESDDEHESPRQTQEVKTNKNVAHSMSNAESHYKEVPNEPSLDYGDSYDDDGAFDMSDAHPLPQRNKMKQGLSR